MDFKVNGVKSTKLSIYFGVLRSPILGSILCNYIAHAEDISIFVQKSTIDELMFPATMNEKNKKILNRTYLYENFSLIISTLSNNSIVTTIFL